MEPLLLCSIPCLTWLVHDGVMTCESLSHAGYFCEEFIGDKWIPLMKGQCCEVLLFVVAGMKYFNTLRPRQNGRCFADDIFKRISLNENARISIKISLKFVPKGPINNNPALVQIMAWCRSGDKPLSEPMINRNANDINGYRILRFCQLHETDIISEDHYRWFSLQHVPL